MAPRFGRVLTAMISPFDDELALDVDGAVTLARWLQEQGNDGLILAGTTGESPTLSRDEKLQLWEAVSAAVTIPIIAGSTGSNTAADVELTVEAERCGVAAILALCPYYSRPSQAGIAAHIGAIATATDLPVMIYDIPVRTGRKVATDVLIDLAERHSNVVAVKDAAGNPAETSRLIANAPNGFEVYSGDDALTLSLLAVGAVGLVGVATHWVTPEMVALFDAVERGDLAEAQRLHGVMLPSFDFETSDEAPNPTPAKAMMRHLQLPSGRCRPPLDAEPEWVATRAAELATELLAGREQRG